MCKSAAENGGHKISRYSWFTVYVITGTKMQYIISLPCLFNMALPLFKTYCTSYYYLDLGNKYINPQPKINLIFSFASP